MFDNINHPTQDVEQRGVGAYIFILQCKIYPNYMQQVTLIASGVLCMAIHGFMAVYVVAHVHFTYIAGRWLPKFINKCMEHITNGYFFNLNSKM